MSMFSKFSGRDTFGMNVFRKYKFGGFTLIEMMVAISLFSVAILLISGAYIALLSANRKERISTDAINNISTAVDSMVRDIRTGSCAVGQCISGEYSHFTFTNSDGCTVTYELDALTSQKLERTNSCTGETDMLTNPNAVSVSNLTFSTYLFKETSTVTNASAEQVWVTILVTGKTPPAPSTPPQTFHIETGATMRSINVL